MSPGLESRKSAAEAFNIKMSNPSAFPEINVLGMTVDEAVAQLDKYLDDAYIAHLPQVRIVTPEKITGTCAGIHI